MALPPVTTRLEIPEWTGGRLSNGDFLAYAAAVAGIYSAAGLQALSIEEAGERLLRTVEELNAAFNRQRSFDETTNISWMVKYLLSCEKAATVPERLAVAMPATGLRRKARFWLPWNSEKKSLSMKDFMWPDRAA